MIRNRQLAFIFTAASSSVPVLELVAALRSCCRTCARVLRGHTLSFIYSADSAASPESGCRFCTRCWRDRHRSRAPIELALFAFGARFPGIKLAICAQSDSAAQMNCGALSLLTEANRNKQRAGHLLQLPFKEAFPDSSVDAAPGRFHFRLQLGSQCNSLCQRACRAQADIQRGGRPRSLAALMRANCSR